MKMQCFGEKLWRISKTATSTGSMPDRGWQPRSHASDTGLTPVPLHETATTALSDPLLYPRPVLMDSVIL